MKIGYVLDDSLQRADGVQQYVRTIGAWMTENGHEVHYLTGGPHQSRDPRIYVLSKNLTVRYNRNVLSMPIHAPRGPIKQVLEREQFDILHVQMPYSPLLAGKVIRLSPARTAIVGTFHIYPFSKSVAKANKLLSMVNSRTIHRLDEICSVSRAAQLFAKTNAGIKSRYIPNAVEMRRFQVAKPYGRLQKDITAVFVGRLVKRKGVLQLLRAIHYLHAQESRAVHKVIICGAGPQKEELIRYIEMHQLQEVVEMKGFVSEEAKARYLASADIAVFPSLGGESFGIVLLEAMAAGAVVMGGDNPGYREVLGGDNEALVNPEDTAVFAECLQKLAIDKQFRRTMRARQQALLRQFDVEVVGKQLHALYRSAIEKKCFNQDNNG